MDFSASSGDEWVDEPTSKRGRQSSSKSSDDSVGLDRRRGCGRGHGFEKFEAGRARGGRGRSTSRRPSDTFRPRRENGSNPRAGTIGQPPPPLTSELLAQNQLPLPKRLPLDRTLLRRKPSVALQGMNTPGGCMRPGNSVPLEQSPGDTLRPQPLAPHYPEEVSPEKENLLNECPVAGELLRSPHTSATHNIMISNTDVSTLHSPTPSSPPINTNAVTRQQETPSSLGSKQRLTAAKRKDDVDYGSDLDDGFDINASHEVISWDISDNDEVDTSTLRNIEALERQMDQFQSNLLGDNDYFEWTGEFDSFRGFRTDFTPTGTPGPVGNFGNPYDAFVAIWDRSIMELIVTETNRYASQTISKKRANNEIVSHSRLHQWKPTTVEELYRLFGIFIFMGIDNRKRISEYWDTSSYLEMPRFRQLMSSNRYTMLSKFLHFVNNDDENQSSLQCDGKLLDAKLYKLSPIIHHLNDKFSKLYVLHENISIDESLTLFKGHLSWNQMIRSKAAHFGIKSIELCESQTGYMYRFEIYTGKSSKPAAEPTSSSANLGSKTTQIVLRLLQGLEGQGYCLTMDNFYNSPVLARYLKTLGFDCFGTLRPNKKNIPDAIKNFSKAQARGNWMARHCGDISLFAWKDCKVVHMISTYHDTDFVPDTLAGRNVMKPKIVRDYNATMGGVDLKDQKLSMYLLERTRGVKWYIKMFKRLLNVSIHNAYILYKQSQRAKHLPDIEHRTFRYQLATSLVELESQVERPPEPHSAIRLQRNILHTPCIWVTVGKSRRRCARCSAIGKVSRVKTFCKTCDAGLCLAEDKSCWTDYHTLHNLKSQ